MRYGTGQWPGLDAQYLFADRIYPVCSPAFLDRTGVPKTVADLDSQTLLETHGITGDQWLDWATWFRYAGHRATGMRRRYLNYHISVQLALAGEGYALGWHSFVGDLVEEGRLVRPLDVDIGSPGAFYLTLPNNRPVSADTKVFADWLLEISADT